MRGEVKALALAAKGFLSEAEGMALYQLAAESSGTAPCLEVGSYCGKSALFLGEGCRRGGKHPLFTIDHHRGSEEQQPGQLYFDPELYDWEEEMFTTFHHLMRNVRRAGLADWIVPIVAESGQLRRYWRPAALSLLFIDGGHSEEAAFADYHGWSDSVLPGGYLCIHDIFTDPAEGGQAPYHVLQDARSTGHWMDCGQVETLGILRRR